MTEPVRLPCSRCATLDFLWLVDNWQPLCLVCATAAMPTSKFLNELLNKRVAKIAVTRMRQRTHPEEFPKAG
jgi:hypothetical protein